MLLANLLIAEHLFTFCKEKTLLRAHNDIEPLKKEYLSKFLVNVGIEKIDLSNSKGLSVSL